MARFNPDVSATPTSNYVSASQGQTPNRGLGMLFGALADAVDLQGKLNKKNEDKAFKQDLSAGVDAIGQPIIDEATGATPKLMPPSTTPDSGTEGNRSAPPGILAAKKRLESINVAISQGVTDPKRLELQKIALIKELKVKYPDRVAEIDNLVETMFNVTPANRLAEMARAELQAQQASASAEEKARFQFAKEEADYIADPAFLAGYKRATGRDFTLQDYDRTAAVAAIAPLKTQQRLSKEHEDTLKRADANDARSKKKAGEAIFGQASLIKNKLLYTAFNKMSERTGGDELSRKFGMAAGLIERGFTKPLSPEEANQAAQMILQLRTEMQLTGDRFLAQTNESGTAYRDFLSTSEQQAFMSELTQPLDILERALAGKSADLSIVKNMKDLSEAMHADPNNQYVKDAEVMKRWETIKTVVGADKFNTIMLQTQNDAAFQSMSDKDKGIYFAVQAYLYGGTPISDVMKVMVPMAKADDTPGVAKAAVEGFLSNLGEEMTPAEAATRAKQIYGKENADLLEDYFSSNPEPAFLALTDPKWLEKVPSEYKKSAYLWARKSANSVLKPLAQELTNAQRWSDTVVIKMDPKTGQASMDSIAMGQPRLDALEEGSYYSQAQKSIALFNRYSERYLALADMAGVKHEDALTLLFGDENLTNIQKEGGFFRRLGNSLVDALRKDSPPPATGVEGGETTPPEPGPQSSIDSRAKGFLSFISSAEGADYQTMYGGRKVDLQKKTVAQVLTLNKAHGKRTGSSATGAYQVMHDTLRGLVRNGVVKEDELFTEDVQDRIALALLNEKGYQKYLDGKISAETFANRVAGVWAALPLASGKSKYHKDKMNNKATVSRAAFLKQIKALKEEQA